MLIVVVRKLCWSARSNLNNKQWTTFLPELIVNQPTDVEKQKHYNSSGTQTTVIEENDNEKEQDESISDDIEIISDNSLQDGFVQLDLNKCNEQQQKVIYIHLLFSHENSFFLDHRIVNVSIDFSTKYIFFKKIILSQNQIPHHMIFLWIFTNWLKEQRHFFSRCSTSFSLLLPFDNVEHPLKDYWCNC
jgi:hypothetical protein